MHNPVALIVSLLAQAGLWLAAFVSVFPFYWMVVGATNTANDITGGKVTFGSSLDDNITKFFTLVDAPRVFGNSFFIAITGTILTLIVTSLAGYGFEIFRSKARDRVFGALLLLLSVPFAALMVPLFVMISRAGLANTYVAILLPGIAANWNSYLWPLIVLQTNEMKTITLVVASLASAYTPDYGLIMIANVLATLPTILVFLLLQRRFVEGMLGSVK